MIKKIIVLLCINIILLQFSCLKKSEPIALKKRVLTYWKLRTEKLDDLKYSKKYDFYNDFLENKKKKIISKSDFYNKFNIKLKSPKISKIDYYNNGKSAVVHYKAGVTVGKYFMDNVILKLDWVFEEGRWKISLNPPKNIFFPKKHKIIVK